MFAALGRMNIIFIIITDGCARRLRQTLVRRWRRRRRRRRRRQRRRPGFRKGAKLHSGKVEKQEEVALLLLSVGEVPAAREAIIKYNCNK